MNIYKPYELLAETPEMLHLKQNDARERVLFNMYRIVPIAILLGVWFVLQQIGAQIPMGFNYTVIIIAVLAGLLLLFRSYITEIKIAAGNIYLLQKTVTGTRELNIAIQQVDYVAVKGGKGSGASFVLHTKDKKSLTLLQIPSRWADEKNSALIEETLRLLLHVEVKRQ